MIEIIRSFFKKVIPAKAGIQTSSLRKQGSGIAQTGFRIKSGMTSYKQKLNSELRTPRLPKNRFGGQANSELSLQRGFTLIEIVIVIVILSIVSAITIKFLIDGLRIYTMTVNQKTLYDEGKLALERMCRDIRDARSITTPALGGSGNTIVFQRTNATGAGQDGANETLTFRLTGTTLEKVKTSPGATSSLASNVSNFTVTRGAAATNNENEITLLLTLSLGTGEIMSLQTKVYPKNLPTSSTYKNFRQYWREVLSS